MTAHYPSLRGAVVVITGGATGIGEDFARSFHRQQARVHVLDIDRASGEALCAELAGPAPDTIPAEFHHGDLTDIAALQATIERIGREEGRIDTLINNAANDTRHDWRTLTEEAWDACQAVNLKHQFFAAQAAHPFLKASQNPSIICLGSISWLKGVTGMVGYTTAKAAVHGLVRTLAGLVGSDGIRVNAILPGWVMTEKQRRLWVDEAAEREIREGQALPGFLEPRDISAMALFLAATDARMCTRQTFIVDGGWT